MRKVHAVLLEIDAKTQTVTEFTCELRSRLMVLTHAINDSTIPTIVILPENFLFYSADSDRIRGFAASAESKFLIESLSGIAQEFKVWLVAGSLPTLDDGKYYIETICFNNTGNIVGRYRKCHLFKAVVNGVVYDESDTYTAGKNLLLFEISGLKFGLAVCFDLRFPKMFLALRQAGADVLVVPAAFTAVTGELAWESLLRARAIENQCYVLGCCLAGKGENGCLTWGHSLIVGPNGAVKAHIDKRAYAELILDGVELDMVRQSMPLEEKLF